ncbi:MAG: glycosyltransferase family 2 protein [Roseiarcus sp.]
MSLAVIIPTRNRPQEIDTVLNCLSYQSRRPDVVVIVDGSDPMLQCETIVASHRNALNIEYLQHWPPSAAAQRNAGIESIVRKYELIALIDDDIDLPPIALSAACDAIESTPAGFVGFGFNTTEPAPKRGYGTLKSSALAERLGLYSKRVGTVSSSGWHTRLLRVSELTEVEWLLSGAVIWRASILKTIRFDEYFERYSYLEDLDLSLQARRLGGRLAILPRAEFTHRAAKGGEGHGSPFWFGRVEVRNRRYIVRKHGLSMSRFWLGMTIRAAATFGSFATGNWREAGRLAGNLDEIVRSGTAMATPRNWAAK